METWVLNGDVSRNRSRVGVLLLASSTIFHAKLITKSVVKCSILAFYLRFIILKLPQRINYALISFTALITLWWFLVSHSFLDT